MKILIIGANGQLGREFTEMLKSGTSTFGPIPDKFKNAEIVTADINELDITDDTKVAPYMKEVKPDFVINCAAYTNVDGCESNTETAFMVNGLGAKNLIVATENVGATLVHISTDYVFDGEGSVPYTEASKVNPVSVYGKTKVIGEQYVENFGSKYFVIRTAWLYGKYGKNFVYTIMNKGKELGKLKVVRDQVGNPTNAEDLAYNILRIAETDNYGIYHCTGEGKCSWYDFACEIIKLANIDCTVDPCTSDEYKQAAKRPSYSCLDNKRLRETIGDEMRNWREALKSFMDRI